MELSKYYEKRAEAYENHAKTQISGERVRKPLFTPAEEHGNVDASGWCLKQARKLRKLAAKKRKNFKHKQRQRKSKWG